MKTEHDTLEGHEENDHEKLVLSAYVFCCPEMRMRNRKETRNPLGGENDGQDK